MVTEWGLSPKIGAINCTTEQGHEKSYSQKTNRTIDEEVRRIVNERYAACRTIIEEHRGLVEKLAELLLKKETLSLPDIVDTLGDRPHGVKESIAEYLTELRERESEVDDTRAEEEKLADQKLKEAIDDTKFDPNADLPDENAE